MSQTFQEEVQEIKDEIFERHDSLNEKLITRGDHILMYGPAEAQVEVNSRTVYVDVFYPGDMNTSVQEVDQSIERMMGFDINTLKELAREGTVKSSGTKGGYRWSLSLEVPTEDLLDLTQKDNIIEQNE